MNARINTSDPLAALLAATAEGNREAFRSLYEEAAPRLLGVARRIMRRADLAEEVLQDGFIKIWKYAQRFDPDRGSSLTWMAVIIRRTALDRLPQQRSEEPLDAEVLETLSVQDEAPMSEPRLKPCLAALPELQRQAVILAFVYGLSHSEIAEKLEAPLGTAKSWVRRGLQQLKACLGS